MTSSGIAWNPVDVFRHVRKNGGELTPFVGGLAGAGWSADWPKGESSDEGRGEMSVRLFVGNLSYDTTEGELRDYFSAAGPVSYIHFPKDRDTGKPRGFAFVEFAEPAQAEDAIRRFNNQMFKGRALAINEARAREDRPRAAMSPQLPPSYRSSAGAGSSFGDPPPRDDKPSRNFGPDARPARARGRGKGGAKSERAPKGPMREVVRGRFFGGDEDESVDDDLDLENFASRVSDDQTDGETSSEEVSDYEESDGDTFTTKLGDSVTEK
jgi:RNA recognition motif-containing protein